MQVLPGAYDFAHRAEFLRDVAPRLGQVADRIGAIRASLGADPAAERSVRYLEEQRASTREKIASLDTATEESWDEQSGAALASLTKLESYVDGFAGAGR